MQAIVFQPLARMVVHTHLKVNDQNIDHLVYEGEAQMSQAQQDEYRALIGDGQARVSVSRDLSEKDYGNGGGVQVTVSLTCDQSQAALNQAIVLAHQLADSACWHYQSATKQQLIDRGVLRPS